MNRTKLAAAAAFALASASSFAAGPSAGDLSAMTPDAATILTAISAVALVGLGVTLAIKGFSIVKRLVGRMG